MPYSTHGGAGGGFAVAAHLDGKLIDEVGLAAQAQVNKVLAEQGGDVDISDPGMVLKLECSMQLITDQN